MRSHGSNIGRSRRAGVEQHWGEFWSFYQKYKKMAHAAAARRVEGGDGRDPAAPSEVLGLPRRYHRRYRVNLAVSVDAAKVARQHSSEDAHSGSLAETEDVVRSAQQAMAFFEDYKQKMRFKRLQVCLACCTKLSLAI